MYKGQLKGFPKEVVEKMLDEQEAQGNKRSIRVFEEYVNSSRGWKGFDWLDTEAGIPFWEEVITNRNFTLFFERYPKQQMFKRGDKILVWNTDEECAHERIALTYIECAYYPVICVATEDEYNFINGKTFNTVKYRHWKPIPQVTEITMEEVAKALGKEVGTFKIID